MKRRLQNLLSVKSLVTIAMTAALIVLLFRPIEPQKELLTLFCTSYGAVITYFFTKKDSDSMEDNNGQQN